MHSKIKIGLEIHGYLNMSRTKQKLFCTCAINPDAEPNTNICPVCTAQPGCKPMLPNKEAVEKIILCGMMLGCKINDRLLFQRKHYSWPDLPSGYQRTMSGSYAVPVGEHGKFMDIGITEVHLEEDPAKWEPSTGNVDYNRSGFPLIEIVTEPDFDDVEKVREWLRKMMISLSYVNAIDENAGIKADVNVSVSPKFQRVEIKNVNSYSSIIKAIKYEAERQKQELSEGREIKQETRAWDDSNEKTVFMRTKETAQDYMFIPEPDLPVINITKEFLDELKEKLPETPEVKIKRYTDLGIDKMDAEVLASEKVLAEIYEKVSKHVSPILTAKWLRRELMRVVNYNKMSFNDLQITEKHLIDLLKLVEEKKITENVAHKMIEELVVNPYDVHTYVQKNNLITIQDSGEIEKYCKEAIAENPAVVADYKSGNEKSFNFLVGQIMRKSKGKAKPDEVNKILKKLVK